LITVAGTAVVAAVVVVAAAAMCICPMLTLTSVCGTSPTPVNQELAFNVVYNHSPFVWRQKNLKNIVSSVVSAQANVFAKKLSKIGEILRIFDKLDEIKSRWVLCQG
jgi:hypothetical protein